MSLLALISLALTALQTALPALTKNPAFASVAQSIQAAIAALSQAHTEIITKNELESLRTHPQW